jgi:hypothetical protein
MSTPALRKDGAISRTWRPTARTSSGKSLAGMRASAQIRRSTSSSSPAVPSQGPGSSPPGLGQVASL